MYNIFIKVNRGHLWAVFHNNHLRKKNWLNLFFKIIEHKFIPIISINLQCVPEGEDFFSSVYLRVLCMLLYLGDINKCLLPCKY